MADPDSADAGPVLLCIEASESLVEPMCTTAELQQEMVPFVMSHSLQNAAFLKLTKHERQVKVRMLTQSILSGEFGAGGDEKGSADPDASGPQRFWAHLRAKYGTRRCHLMELLRLLEPSLRGRHVVVLRFESEVHAPTASLLVRSSASCSSTMTAAARAARCEFPTGSFSAATMEGWLQDATSGGRRAPPLWTRLIDECCKNGRAEVRALLLHTEPHSTDAMPEAITLAAHSLRDSIELVPYLSCVTFGPQSSERVAGLEELSAWAGGLSYNVSESAMLGPAANGLCQHVFSKEGPMGAQALDERRQFYAKKQALGTCFLQLPQLGPFEQPLPPVSPGAAMKRSLVDVLRNGQVNFDATVPSESMLAVLMDVTMALPRRWSRGLRVWRMRRELRDVVFAEPGGLGLELDEPNLAEGAPADQRAWRLRTTHPPASALKMDEGSILVAVNQIRVHQFTPRREVARRIAVRPVSLTFRNPPGKSGLPKGVKPPTGHEIFVMLTSEVVVGELREGCPPIKTGEPPLNLALKRVADAKPRSPQDPLKRWQAERVVGAVAAQGTSKGSPQSGGVGLFSEEPQLLYRVMLFCGDLAALVRAGAICRQWRSLLHGARRSGDTPGGSSAQHRLWQWVLRWGSGPTSSQRPGFWGWALAEACGPGGQASGVAGLLALGAAAGAASAAAPGPLGAAGGEVLAAAVRTDPGGFMLLAHSLAGASPGLEVAADTVRRMADALGVGVLPADVLAGLLCGPLHAQRLWQLTHSALPWLMLQGRCFQIALAAQQPQLFRHFMGEGMAPELFYIRWLQGLFSECLSGKELLRLWDMFIFERSHKVFVRVALAVFSLLEQKLRGDVEQIMNVLFDAKAWNLEPGAVMSRALEMKVTRSQLKEAEEGLLMGE